MPKTPSVPSALLAGQEFAPVVLGGDRLGYSLARSFDLGYGYRTLIVSTMLGGPVAHSSLIEHHLVPSLQDPEGLVTELRALATRIGPQKKLLLATTDHVVSVAGAGQAPPRGPLRHPVRRAGADRPPQP